MKPLFLISLSRICVFFLAFTTGMFFAFPASSQAIDTAAYYRITNVSQGERISLTLSGGGTGQLSLLLRATTETPFQYWKFVPGVNGKFRIVNPNAPGKSIDIINDGMNNKLTIATNNNLSGQFWQIVNNHDGTFRIHSLWLGGDKSLDIVKDEKNYKELTMAESGKVDGQLWKFTKIPAQPNAVPAPMVITKSAIDAASVYRLTCQWQGEGKSIGIENDIPLLKATAEDSSQCWKFVPEANGFYRLINQKYTGKSLDIINDGAQNNKVTLALTNNYSGQYWKLALNADGSYRMTTEWQGDTKSLDVLNDGVNNNALILNNTGNYSGQFWKLTKTTLPAPLPPPLVVTTPAVTANDKLMSGEELLPNKKLVSANGKYKLIQQEDGNLVIYNSNDQPTWASQTFGKNVKTCHMQKDGNLVLYLAYHVPVWASNTNGNEGAYLIMQDDGNLVIYGKDGQPIWATNTSEK